ncbi:Mg2+ transporter protein CorA-like/Zinc transport protein ZntB [Lasiodiplodia theobromae]|uniref:Mg2+ transporter protein CorA-like/Zinc transport protein ZntB n=1 Tax=Lasiodiplodia theobromae TaxID=45133 RepID=UPI0015C3E737|nr:Mg2+ transporter protein CorA-like/Zinc transport protein ZntB [Lasiodiplodia theobromae]KAF4539673.1 Mg2+ transporter protein CorA-like/Zinc transport protein ZntB [Lasiodiplodia theobromae]
MDPLEKDVQQQTAPTSPGDWHADPYWRGRRISPAQLLVHDIRLDEQSGGGYRQRHDAAPLLEIKEVMTSAFAAEVSQRGRDRLRGKLVDDAEGLLAKAGCLLALSNWSVNPARVIAAFRKMELCIYQNERFSKHGRYFSPFVQRLVPEWDPDDDDEDRSCPMLISVPFLDWTVQGEPPALRFQVDPREGYTSSRGSSHLLRSILQYFYRLEDTSDREHNQVFSKHKPWINDRDLDLKVRSLYGHYPCGLNVDELWILVIDSRHIVTFSIDRYAGYLGHLQYRLHRSPSTRLVMDLLQVQEELNIIIQITEQQLDIIAQLQDILESHEPLPSERMSIKSRPRSRGISDRHHHQHHRISIAADETDTNDGRATLPPFFRATYRQLSTSALEDPASQLLENLQREAADLRDLRDNSNALLNRTIQLVNIRLEDHGKAILVFTIVTVVFLPLSFVTSFFGMNFSDIRDMDQTQRLFWIVAASVTVGVVGLASFLAFYGGDLVEALMDWRESRAARRRRRRARSRLRGGGGGGTASASAAGFQVLDVSGPGW